MLSRTQTIMKLALSKEEKKTRETLNLLTVPKYESTKCTTKDEKEKYFQNVSAGVNNWTDTEQPVKKAKLNSINHKLQDFSLHEPTLQATTTFKETKVPLNALNSENITDKENLNANSVDSEIITQLSLEEGIKKSFTLPVIYDKTFNKMLDQSLLDLNNFTTSSPQVDLSMFSNPTIDDHDYFTHPVFYETDLPEELSLSINNIIDNVIHEPDDPKETSKPTITSTIRQSENNLVVKKLIPTYEDESGSKVTDTIIEQNNPIHEYECGSTATDTTIEQNNISLHEKGGKKRSDLKDGIYYSISVKKDSLNKKRVYDKRHVCFYCHERKSKITRHLISNHSNEVNVAKCLAMPLRSSKRKEEFLKILRMGDFFHNCEVLEKKEGELILVRRPSNEESILLSPSHYGPCPHCSGFMVKKHLWHHAKTCFCKKSKLQDDDSDEMRCSILQQSNALVASIIYSPDNKHYKENILDKLKCDERGAIAKEDSLIRDFGLVLFEKQSNTQFELIRQSMRQCARLLIELRQITSLASAGLADFITPTHFDNVILAVRNLCSKTSDSPTEQGVPSLALKIGFHLQKCAAILRGRFLRAGLLESDDSTKRFLELYRLEWQDRISARALNEIRNSKMNIANALPLTSDLMKLNTFVKTQLENLTEKLKANNADKESWLELAKTVLCRIILFNKKRSGEASKMKTADFSDVAWASESSSELQNSLSKLEQHLANTLSLIQIRGKRGRIVPVLITPDIKSVMHLLQETRSSVEVHPANEYFFARIHYGSLSHIRGSDCLRDIVNQIHLEKPELIRSTKLRKYVATVSQVFNLDERQVDWLARHLGHDLNVHRNFYRLHESALELTKVSKILLAVDKGIVHKFKGKNIDDLSLEDLEDPNGDEDPEDKENSNNENDSESDEELNETILESAISPGPPTQSLSQESTTQSRQETVERPSNVVKTISINESRHRTHKYPRMIWTDSQRNKALNFFKKEISSFKVPGKERCTEFISNYPEMSNVHWKKVKQFVHNYLNKTRKRLK